MTDCANCRDCIYSFYIDGRTRGCGYLLITDKRRPCPPGEGCTVKQTKGRKNHMARKRTFDHTMAARLLDDGLSVPEVAQLLEVSSTTIYSWKARAYDNPANVPAEERNSTDSDDAAPVVPQISDELPPDDNQSALPSALPEDPTPPPPEWLPPERDPRYLTEEEARALYKFVGDSLIGLQIHSADDVRRVMSVAQFWRRMDRIFGEEDNPCA